MQTASTSALPHIRSRSARERIGHSHQCRQVGKAPESVQEKGQWKQCKGCPQSITARLTSSRLECASSPRRCSALACTVSASRSTDNSEPSQRSVHRHVCRHGCVGIDECARMPACRCVDSHVCVCVCIRERVRVCACARVFADMSTDICSHMRTHMCAGKSAQLQRRV